MGKVFWNKPAIPIPPEAYINRHDGTAFIFVLGNDQKRHSVCIGRMASESTMFPNSTFRDKYRNEWVRFYGEEELKPAEMHLGMYALTLGVSTEISLYPLLQEVYGLACGNMLLDYCMFSLLNRSSATETFPEIMRDEILFSRQCPDDSAYSRLFQDLTKEQHHKFKVKWLEHCKEKGVTKAWISIDGSNNDCEVKKSELSEPGHAKSHNKGGIVSYMYAVNAQDGRPITYFEYEGGMVDSKAFHQIALFLHGAGIEIEGIILDRGFCTDEVIKTIRECGYDFIVMMHGDHFGHTAMVKKHGDTIPWQPEFAVSDDGVFGITEETQLFKLHPETTGFVNLYYDGARGCHQSIKLIREIRQEKRRIEALIAAGKTASVSNGMGKYVHIDTDDNGTRHVNFNYENWKLAMNGKGYFSLASSRDYGAEECLRIYHLRDTSETQYALIKSQEGFHATRVHSTESIRSKFAVAFFGSIIRTEIMLACQNLNFDTNVMIQRMSRLRLLQMANSLYSYTRTHGTAEMSLLNEFGISAQHLEIMGNEYNQRINSNIDDQIRKVPKCETAVFEKRKRGRIKGSKNKKTLEREAEEARINGYRPKEEKEKKKAGRPKGSKDSKPRNRRTKAEMLAAKQGQNSSEG